MLTLLQLRNYATVKEVIFEPRNGLTVLSGETGAGKSILIDALGYILGERVDKSIVRDGEGRAEIEAVFHIQGKSELNNWLVGRDLDRGDDELILRRVVRADGRSSAYINGVSATAADLQDISNHLVHIHSQNDHQALLRKSAHRELLDTYAQIVDDVDQLINKWDSWQKARKKTNEAMEIARNGKEQFLYLKSQLEELANFDPKDGEIQTLESEHRLLSHSHEIIAQCNALVEALEGDGYSNVLAIVNKTLTKLDGMREHSSKLEPIYEAVDSARIQLQYAAQELGYFAEGIEIDSERLISIERRINLAHKIARKFSVRVEELSDYKNQVEADIKKSSIDDSVIDELREKEAKLESEYLVLAEKISRIRKEAAIEIEIKVVKLLQSLGLKGAEFAVNVVKTDSTSYGREEIEFLFNANKGGQLKPLSKVASGGELSRISLAIQVVCARASIVSTLIFDEVDVGVGGGVAEIVGNLLKRLGKQAQVICITHQPQVASQGDAHWLVEKSSSKTSTETVLKEIVAEDRLHEIARMLGGKKMTKSTLDHAEEMLVGGGWRA